MGMRELECAVLAEAREVTGKTKLRMKDIMEWSTGPVESVEGEKVYYLPKLGVNIAILDDGRV